MTIRKKSIDTLKQQKHSFMNFIKTKEKYSELIADLFFDGEIEKNNSIDDVKHYLEGKGISKELIDSLERDYVGYLKSQNYYGSIDNYPEELKQSIKENDKVLSKLKKDILKQYSKYEEFISLDVEKLVDDEFVVLGRPKIENIENVSFWNGKIYKKHQEKGLLKDEMEDIQKKINKIRYQLNETKWFQGKKKKELENKIQQRDLEKKNKEGQLQEVDKIIKEYENNKKIAIKLGDIKRWNKMEVSEIMGHGEYSTINGCKCAIQKVYKELKDCLGYLSSETIAKIKSYMILYIEDNRREKKSELESNCKEILQKYLNYFNYGENKGQYSVVTKTVYSKNRIDPEIMEILNKLGIEISENIFDGVIDYNFMNDVFIHTTGFNVLDEILQEGGLVSTNEIMKRSKYNEDIQNARTQDIAHHKDVYFSRGFRKNGYGHAKSDDDFVFIANTMSNFAGSGYGVPLSDKMQPNSGLNEIDAQHDGDGYSIISKSALKKTYWDDSYSKIDVKDFYIFVSENKKKEIESNSKYKIVDANIIYIPERFKGKMTYDLYEFMKREIISRSKERQKNLIPNKIITDRDGIKSISTSYQWAFCDSAGEISTVGFNPLKNGDYARIFNFLKTNQAVLGFSQLERFSNFKIDFDRLETFLYEKKGDIDNFELTFEYPRELLLLTVLCTKLGLWSNSNDWKKNSLNCIKNKLKEFGYNAKDLGIFCKTVEWISYMVEYKDNLIWDKSLKRNHIESIRKWCDEWSVDFNQMKDFLLKISSISLRNYLSDSVKDILK